MLLLTRTGIVKTWMYGYNEKYDLVVISKTGKLGDVIEISGLKIGLPLTPKECLQRHKEKQHQYWERHELPKELIKNKIYISME